MGILRVTSSAASHQYTGSGGGAALACPVSPTAPNALILEIVLYGVSTGTIITVSSGTASIGTPVLSGRRVSTLDTNLVVEVWAIPILVSGSLTLGITNVPIATVGFAEYSGLDAIPVVDGTPTIFEDTNTVYTTGNVTTTVPGIIIASYPDLTTTSYTYSSYSDTVTWAQNDNNFVTGTVQEKITTASGVYALTLHVSTSFGYDALAVAYKAAAGGVAVVSGSPLLLSAMRPGMRGPIGPVALALRAHRAAFLPASGSNLFFLTLTAGLTPSAVTVRATSLFRGGTLTPSGVAIRLAALVRGGTLTTSANPGRLTILPRGGTLAPSGTVGRLTSLFRGGSLIPTGTAPRQTQRAVGGGLTPTATATRQAQKPVGGTLAPSGSVTKAVSRKFLAALQPLGAAVKAVTKGPFTGTLGISATVQLLRVILLTLTANLTPTATLGRLTSLFRGGSLAPTGGTSRATTHTLRGTLSMAGNTQRLTAKGFTAVLGLSAGIRKAVGKFFTAVLNALGILTNDSTVVELHLVQMEVSPIILTHTAVGIDTTPRASFIDLHDTASPILPDNTGKPYV